jgi:predicted solute-binding protein
VEAFGVDAEFVPMAPQPDEMLRRCDAALLIGDTALFLDHSARGLTKIDLGEAWTRLTGLPFVWAFWAGRPDALSSEDVAELIAARNRGVVASDEIAAEYCGPARASLGQAYLRDNIRYSLGDREQAGLRHFFELALKHDVVEETRELEWY